MTPLEILRGPLPATALNSLHLIGSHNHRTKTAITLRNLQIAEDNYIIPALRHVGLYGKWHADMRTFETLCLYYVGTVTTLAALTAELEVTLALDDTQRSEWCKKNHKLLRERTLARLDAVRPPSIHNEMQILSVLFEQANPALFKQMDESGQLKRPSPYQELVIQAGQGEAWECLFGSPNYTAGSALSYLLLHASSPQVYPLPSLKTE